MSRVSVSSCSSRADDIEYFRQELSLDLARAQLLRRAEKLQEKGQVQQALQYYREVLTAYPNCREAQMNVEMIKRNNSEYVSIPDDAELSFYSEESAHETQFQRLKRLPCGRTEFVAENDVAMSFNQGPVKFRLAKAQSDQLWSEILEALEAQDGLFEGRAPVDADGFSSYTDITAKFHGEEQHFYGHRGTPLEEI
eukprot:TRINITY_DN108447_c0_g1_i1.p1 TRINITY_DN108447_c0_g1~~TRINITY_DN108447_c0_g1_i1.p1  ORF type:complete len:196 (+),score=37.19 TRINITY_DN108447_c0_g1_i1:59-646(+)